MRFECALWQQQAVAASIPWAELDLAESWARIESAPNSIKATQTADLSSPLAFDIAARAKREGRSREDWEPRSVAAKIVEAGLTTEWFTVSCSPRGHLNFKFHTAWYQVMLAAMVSGDWHQAWAASTPAAALPTELRARPLAEAPELASELLSKYAASFLAMGLRLDTAALGDVSTEIWATMLALESDPELSLRPMRLGLYGSENIPWYMGHFEQCAASMARSGEALDSVALESLRFSEVAPYRLWQEEVFQGAAIFWLARLREYVLSPDAPRLRYYRDLMEQLLYAWRMFFAFYNHPANREEASILSRQLISLLHSRVGQVLPLLSGRP